MASEIDPSVIADNVPVEKSDLRTQLQTAADEITEQQRLTSLAWKIARGELSV